ncbi:MAG: hypothetical protein Q4G68_09750 [Planctomycetia bacterium]|nr:hypothetical protein [Planctomycetia bacterium]
MSLWFGYPPIYVIGAPVALLAILAFCRNDSLWGTLIKLFNIFFSSLLAMNFFEPVATIIDKVSPATSFYNDLYAFVVIYVVCMEVLVEVSNRLTRVNVFFPDKVNLFGTYALLTFLWIGFYGVTMFIVMTTLPEAPRMTEYKYPTTLSLVKYVSGSSLAAMGSNAHHFDPAVYLARQNNRNCAAYINLEEKDTWKFDGTSPNLK